MFYLAAAVYVPLSVLLLKYPHLLHRKRAQKPLEQTQRPLIIAHRGGSRQGLQNTMPTMQQAAREGADILETDVCITKDKQVVIHHDLDLSRTCGSNLRIRDLDYAQLPPFQKEVPLHFGQACMPGQGSRIPLLRELLTSADCAKCLVNIEVKERTQEAADLTAQVIAQCGAEGRVIWGANHNGVKNYMRQKYPHLPVFATGEDYLRVHFLFMLGLLPFFSLPFDSFQIPLFSEEWRRSDTSRGQGIGQRVYLFLKFWVIRAANAVDYSIISHLAKRGIPTYYWVCNSEDRYRRAMAGGAAGIMTDEPRKLAKFLQ